MLIEDHDEDPDVYTYLVDFETTGVSEMVRMNDDGSYTVLLNSRMSREKNRESYLHAKKHIHSHDLDTRDGKSVQEIEQRTHAKGV
ncbi:hypothetical protein HMPREF1986_02242 [Oribacterium sp. oral taxon 078 str. F0263]|uniref:hypothetical protein n=1 Tax=Oribacterium sp. oral taxon 078 TaxID=652706 RepID=UPI0003AE177F|nr:hypothetical protein [Oribacterium sp. oral taxon 078]ERL19785.1 hypothetical protein HMPREF1986_02242 [Oribacterium sp. oral taxon 078 str. F0263]